MPIRDYACIKDGIVMNVIVVDEPKEAAEGTHRSGLDANHGALTSYDSCVPLDDLYEGAGIGKPANV